ncbi:acetyl-CoA carboxylase biotin carboxylase subunit [Paracoccus aestuariivivens]|uniref:ATP-grasp domain-containing protein n=1 Tax=Paracoccus aestuariivivens TaxID=1820333 RepID=A0A6L6JFG6_9RHOB|nr:biotin carboxylase N-terminal domain-containing protein [Paracoccus aestuariivivens]MTH80005.1 ATP-grasp domain-containing protein [Paracoccus aestuariivivens]
MSAPFRKVLIANRGEIARRIQRSCRILGIGTVAVHSDADATLAHVTEADEAVRLGPPPARESYLRTDLVLEAATTCGADAIHPGYGFLSENADFAEAVEAAGLVWIGPTPESIRAMGDKQSARDLARAAGVPVVPGSLRFTDDLTGLVSAAEEVGYPLLVKAAAGGGGIGMRRVDTADKLVQVAETTRSMAEKAFGNGTIYLERYVPLARHIEVQVFGYGDGTAIHLHERDCSLQRRFQKVIEESPAPNLPDATRSAMAEAALRLCRTTRYRGAGTVEFILDVATGEFFFLEMNTRIQVEHPVTEAVTGTDLVRMQIELAAGAPDRLDQTQVASTGHAIECRIYAEDPARMFLPSPGVIDRFDLPPAADWLRIDAAYGSGDTITPHYDPMIAKAIVHGPDRQAALARARQALRAIRIDGVKTNIELMIACLSHDGMISGQISTGFLEQNRPTLLASLQTEATT